MQTLSSDTVAAYYDRFRGPASQLSRTYLGRLRYLVFIPLLFFFTRGPQHDPNGPLLLDIRL